MRRSVIALIAVIIAGCGPAPVPPYASALIVKGPSGSTVRLTNLSDSGGEVDDYEFRVKDQTLSIRDRTYGTVKLGEVVEVDANGAVRVRGEGRPPS
jgi:hypothetical protein